MFLFKIDKQPWLAVNLSLFFPGLGQVYAGKYFRGLSLIIIQTGLLMIAFWSIYSPQGDTIVALFFISILIIVYLANLFDAYYCVKKPPSYTVIVKATNKFKDPWYALFLSRILPGLGHLYIQKTLLALVLLTITIIVSLFDHISDYLLIFLPIITAFSTHHVYFDSPKNLSEKRQQYNSKGWLKAMTILILISGIANSYLPNIIKIKIEPFIIPSTSMVPTLQVKDRVLVHKSKNYHPKIGDIIVFKPTQSAKEIEKETNSEPADFYIKRVIAVPSQTIKIENGLVFIDGQPLIENYIKEPTNYYLPTTVVPANSYCVLGDNRNDSFDSHIWGFLPQEKIVGKAYKIYWPGNRVQQLTN